MPCGLTAALCPAPARPPTHLLPAPTLPLTPPPPPCRFTQNTILEWPTPEGAYVLADQQVLFYCLDTLPILLCFATYILAHPGYLLPPLNPRGRDVVDKLIAQHSAAGAAAEAGKAGQGSESPSLEKDTRQDGLSVAVVA